MANIHELRVNGKRVAVDTPPDRNLLQVLREDLDLTGAKYGCGEAQCGACTVLLDGRAVPACVTAVAAAAGGEIITVEGLEAADATLHPVQQAFLEIQALQCGYCTPGMVMASVALLRQNSDPTEEQIVRALHPNVCRCGTYLRIVRTVLRAAQLLREERPSANGAKEVAATFASTAQVGR